MTNISVAGLRCVPSLVHVMQQDGSGSGNGIVLRLHKYIVTLRHLTTQVSMQMYLAIVTAWVLRYRPQVKTDSVILCSKINALKASYHRFVKIIIPSSLVRSMISALLTASNLNPYQTCRRYYFSLQRFSTFQKFPEVLTDHESLIGSLCAFSSRCPCSSWLL